MKPGRQADPDLRSVLAAWPFDPDDILRVVTGTDQRPILQIRTPLGIEQIELEGRPDGFRPHDCESLLAYHEQRLESARSEGRESAFQLEAGECAELVAEGQLYYQRYLRLFQLKDWQRTVRDTARNLKLFDFVRRQAAREEDRWHLEKWRPYVLRINGAAAAFQAADHGEHDRALGIVQTTLDQIEALPELAEEVFDLERARSVEMLKEVHRQLQRARPVPAAERLTQELQEAIRREEFERAAALRDRIRALKQPASELPGQSKTG